jgi:hypothetical protein
MSFWYSFFEPYTGGTEVGSFFRVIFWPLRARKLFASIVIIALSLYTRTAALKREESPVDGLPR